MEVIDLTSTPAVINEAVIGGVDDKGVAISTSTLAGLPDGHHVLALPVDEHPMRKEPNSEQVEDLRERLQDKESENVHISMNGEELLVDLEARLNEAEPGNDFGFTGEVINFYKV